MNDFIPLHINSVYTFLNSNLTIENIISIAKKNNLNAISLTDFASLSGAIKFCSLSSQQNIKPIIGIDFKINGFLITFLIKNEIGYQNILRILDLYNSDILTIEKCANHNNGLIIIISSQQSKLLEKLEKQNNNEVNVFLKKIENAFSNDFFIGLEIYDNVNLLDIKKIRSFISENHFQCVAFPFIKHKNLNDSIDYLIIKSIRKNKVIDKKKIKEKNYYFYDELKIKKNYSKEEIQNTKKISDLINFNIIEFVKQKNKKNTDSQKNFKEIVFDCLKKKIKTINNTYSDRLNYEIEIINNSNYTDYFLVVADYIKFAKKNDIYIGPGRGSAGGSLVAYALDITTIDPIKYDLLFERFLNKNRKKMPDIDVDVESEKRKNIIEYLKKKYGKNNISYIPTIQKIKAKQALKYIEKLFNIKEHYINNLINALQDIDDLNEAYKKKINFRKLINSDKYYLFIVKMAKKIEYLPFKFSTHASGIIINHKNLLEIIPTFKNLNNEDDITTGFTNDDLEILNITKVDILSLRNLDTIKKIINNINENSKNKINFYSLPFEDKKTIETIAKGYTAGIFQLESKNDVIKTIKEKNIASFNDVVLLISLYRPGSIKFINDFLDRKLKIKEISYPSKKIIDILKPTYGIIIFQEQIIKIVSILTNCDFNEADIFRRNLISKDKINSLEKIFINKSIKNGCSIAESKNTFKLLRNFADFNFNKSHAVAYAKLICQMAFLKTNYSLFFYTTILNQNGKSKNIINELQEKNIPIYVPEINDISDKFEIKNNSIVFSIFAINISKQSASSIIKEKKLNGPFDSFESFITRTTVYHIPMKEIEIIINSGCFDCFNKKRNELRESLKNIFNFAILTKNTNNNCRDKLIPKPKIKKNIDIDLKNEIINEYNSLDFVLTPILKEKYQEIVASKKATLISNIKKNNNIYNVVCFFKKNFFINKNSFIVNDIFGFSMELIKKNIDIDYNKIIDKLLLITCFFSFKEKKFIAREIKIL